MEYLKKWVLPNHPVKDALWQKTCQFFDSRMSSVSSITSQGWNFLCKHRKLLHLTFCLAVELGMFILDRLEIRNRVISIACFLLSAFVSADVFRHYFKYRNAADTKLQSALQLKESDILISLLQLADTLVELIKITRIIKFKFRFLNAFPVVFIIHTLYHHLREDYVRSSNDLSSHELNEVSPLQEDDRAPPCNESMPMSTSVNHDEAETTATPIMDGSTAATPMDGSAPVPPMDGSPVATPIDGSPASSDCLPNTDVAIVIDDNTNRKIYMSGQQLRRRIPHVLAPAFGFPYSQHQLAAMNQLGPSKSAASTKSASVSSNSSITLPINVTTESTDKMKLNPRAQASYARPTALESQATFGGHVENKRVETTENSQGAENQNPHNLMVKVKDDAVVSCGPSSNEHDDATSSRQDPSDNESMPRNTSVKDESDVDVKDEKPMESVPRDAKTMGEIKDRSKDVIVSGGENISSVELEAVLYRHPRVLEAAVVAMPHPRWGESPCAFIALRKDQNEVVTESEILSYCRKNLPGYMVPKKVEFMSELPKTSTGKIHKFELREKAKSFEVKNDKVVVKRSTNNNKVKEEVPSAAYDDHHRPQMIFAMSCL